MVLARNMFSVLRLFIVLRRIKHGMSCPLPLVLHWLGSSFSWPAEFAEFASATSTLTSDCMDSYRQYTMCSLYWRSVKKKPMVIKTRTSIGAPNLHPHKLPTTALLQQHKMFLQIFIQTNFAGCTTRRWCGQSSSCCSWRLKHLQPPAVAATAKTSHDASKKIKKGRKKRLPKLSKVTWHLRLFLHILTASVPLDSPQSEISTDQPVAYPRFSSPSSVVQRFMPNSEQQAPVVFLT